MLKPLALGSAIACLALPAASAEPARRTAAVSVGATLPLTGSEAKGGTGYREGYELAAELANAGGGLKVFGRRLPVKLEIVDDQSKPENVTRLTERLVKANRVDAVLGTFSSGLADAQSGVAEKLAIPYVVAASAKPIFSRGYKYVFGTQSPVDLLATALLRWVDEQQKAGALPTPARIAVAWENTAHGRDYRQGVFDFAGPSGRRAAYSVVLDEGFELGTKDFKGLLGRVRDAQADVFLVDAHLADYIAMQKQYAALGLCHRVLSYGARGPEKEALAALPPHAADYILSAIWWNAQLGSKGLTKKFVETFRAKYGREPEWYQALAYESARALFAAIEKAGSTDHEAVREALVQLNMESILPGGYLRFPKEYGQMAHYLFVVQQNQPDGSAPLVYPRIAATHEGLVNPRCGATASVPR